MKLITDSALYDAATHHPDLNFRLLLTRLLAAISCDGEFDPAELVRLVIIEPGDTPDAVNVELGYTLTSDWEASDRVGNWTALLWVVSDWGEGIAALIPANRPDIDPAFLHLCSETPETR